MGGDGGTAGGVFEVVTGLFPAQPKDMKEMRITERETLKSLYTFFSLSSITGSELIERLVHSGF